jgi:hypothetical protein
VILFEFDKLPNTLASTIVETTKTVFARYGSPMNSLTDNGPQFFSSEYAKFSSFWNTSPAHHITASQMAEQGQLKSCWKVQRSILGTTTLDKHSNKTPQLYPNPTPYGTKNKYIWFSVKRLTSARNRSPSLCTCKNEKSSTNVKTPIWEDIWTLVALFVHWRLCLP